MPLRLTPLERAEQSVIASRNVLDEAIKQYQSYVSRNNNSTDFSSYSEEDQETISSQHGRIKACLDTADDCARHYVDLLTKG